MIDPRPAFPSKWESLDITPDELDLAHTLPVGQTFLWHRQPVPLRNVPELSKIEQDLCVKLEESSFEPPLVEHDEQPTTEWSRAIRDPPRVLLLRQSSTKIYYTSIPATPSPTAARDKEYLLDLFNMDITAPYGTLRDVYQAWAVQDPALFGKAWGKGEVPRGVRVLRQDPWECLLSFITSSANNVPRITSLLHRLSTHFSPPLMTLPAPGHDITPPIEGDQPIPYITYHLFPRPLDLLLSVDGTNTMEQLETTLGSLGFGYRAGFISSSLSTLISSHGTPEERTAIGMPEVSSASTLAEGEVGMGDTQGVEMFLHSLRRGGAKYPVVGEEDRWRGELLALKGVGRKVADCIGLMSLDRSNIVPIDTHLQQIAARHPKFPGKLKGKATSTETVYSAVQGFLRDLWGAREGQGTPQMQLAGWCQSVMFAADLKGSTAVVKIEVKEEVKEELALAAGRGMRRVKKEVERPASLVSEMVSGQTTPITDAAEPPTKMDSLSGLGTIDRKRKRQTLPQAGAILKKKTTTKVHTKAQTGRHISDMMTSVKREVKEEVKLTRRGVSGRSERYSARCDKLEVDVMGLS